MKRCPSGTPATRFQRGRPCNDCLRSSGISGGTRRKVAREMSQRDLVATKIQLEVNLGDCENGCHLCVDCSYAATDAILEEEE
jgi:hypothetical protein